MPKLLDHGVLTDDRWQLIENQAQLSDLAPDQGVLVPLSIWDDRNDMLAEHTGPVGLWLDVDTDTDELTPSLRDATLVGIRFPAFNDGRGLSLAVLLRTRLGFSGELRAVGDVHEDVIHYMDRCGFDSFSLADERNLETARCATIAPSEHYQGSVREPAPVFRRLQRA